MVRRGVERERGLSGQDADFLLLRLKGPRERVARVGVEGDADAAVEVGSRDEAFGSEPALVGLRGAAVAGSGAECAVEGHGEVRACGDDEDRGGRVQQEAAVPFLVASLPRPLVRFGGGVLSPGWWRRRRRCPVRGCCALGRVPSDAVECGRAAAHRRTRRPSRHTRPGQPNSGRARSP